MPTNKFEVDVTKIRDDARAQMAQGPVTTDYGLDVDAVVDVLNQVVATEIVCWLRYTQHAIVATGIDRAQVSAEFSEHAAEEREHMEMAAERISQLGGTPDLSPEGLKRSHTDFATPEDSDLKGMLEENLVAERIVISTYQEIVRWLGDNDPTTRRLIEAILAQEEEHADDLLDLLGRLSVTDVGFFLSGEELAPGEIVRYGRLAEQHGFDRVWVSDHYHPWISEQGQSPFVWSVLGALAATTQLRLTTAVTCPTFRIHPAVLAQASATVACLAPGRFRFGVGSGEALNEHILGDAWPPVSVRHARLREALEIIRALWTGEVLTHEGGYFTVHNAKVWSLPAQPPPILVSGFGPVASALAAEIGDGWVTVSPDAQGLRAYRDAGGSGLVQGGLKICWAETEKEAAETACRLWGHEQVGGQTAQDIAMWQGFEAIAASATPDQVAAATPCGPDPARAAEAIAAYVELGFDEVYVAQVGPDQESGIAFLREQVLPLLG